MSRELLVIGAHRAKGGRFRHVETIESSNTYGSPVIESSP